LFIGLLLGVLLTACMTVALIGGRGEAGSSPENSDGARSSVPTLSPADASPEDVVLIDIRARAFLPSTVKLHTGRKTRLVFQNHDAELHAFVPVGLFVGVNLNITGNGAPEFGAEGFKRVIIPSSGEAIIRFVPEHAGIYPFFCDMPGHSQMRATIIVE
jgi:plastocyanin